MERQANVVRIAILGREDTRNINNYRGAAEQAGASVVLLDPCEDGDAIRAQLERVDGIILPGGEDVNPVLYHEENTASVGIDDVRDRTEWLVTDIAVQRGLPLLGICRGLQFINVYFGGTLIQDIEHHDLHTYDNGDKVHRCRLEGSSFLREIYGREEFSVNSAHHQAIGRLGEGLRSCQFSEDGLIEAICHETLPFYCVQWHPERMCLSHKRDDTVDGMPLFSWFLQQITNIQRRYSSDTNTGNGEKRGGL